MPAHEVETIRQFLRLTDSIGTAGQPTEEQLRAIQEAGYDVVVNLLPDTPEALPGEDALVGSLGMGYVQIPVAWVAPTQDDLERFFTVMDASAGKRVFVHCAANKRVSAFLYLYRVLRENADPEAAAEDLHRIWTPNETWQRFIEDALVAGFQRMASTPPSMS